MGIENLFLCGIFFDDPSSLSGYGDGEKIRRAELYKKANAVGNSGYQTYLADPQPTPDLIIKTPSVFEIRQGIIRNQYADSVNYTTQNYKLLGGITQLNHEELQTMIDKYSKDK